MIPEPLQNPETAAIGLDVGALNGRTIAEIRALVDRDDCALVVATEGVPPHLPPEIMRKTLDVHEGKPSLDWMYQTDAGDWREWNGYILDHDFVSRHGDPPREIVYAEIYTLRSRATPGMRVRPIVALWFDLQGVCVMASEVMAQVLFLRLGAAERMQRMASSEVPRTTSTTSRLAPHVDADSLAQAFGLPPVAEELVINDWDPRDPHVGRFLWSHECELKGLLLNNARLDMRLSIMPDRDGRWSLSATEGEALLTPIALSPQGLRVAFRSPAGEVGPTFDIYAGDLGLRLVQEDGVSFRLDVLIEHTPSSIAPPPVFRRVKILARPSDEPGPPGAVAVRLVDSEKRLAIETPAGTRRCEVLSLSRPSPPAAGVLLDARLS